MSRYPIYTQRAFLLDAIRVLMAETEPGGHGTNLIEDCLISLTLEEMCQIVQVQSIAGYRKPEGLLTQALEVIERKLYLTGSQRLNRYWVSISETLKQPAQRLGELQARLIIDHQERTVRQRFEEGVEVPFEILHLPEIEALVAIPIKARCYLDLNRVQSQERWVISGEYFPFEIHVRDLTFIVSSAGEIILGIRSFPDSLIREVMGILREIAQTLYTDGKPHFRATVEDSGNSDLFQLEGEEE